MKHILKFLILLLAWPCVAQQSSPPALPSNLYTTPGGIPSSPSSGGGLTSVTSLPVTCTPGTTQPVQLTASITVAGLTYAPSTLFYCDSTNHFSPVSQGSGAGPNIAFYLAAQCPPSNAAQCVNTPANTQQSNACAYTSASPNVSCFTQIPLRSASVTSNVATYVSDYPFPSTWVAGQSVTIGNFSVGLGDGIFNQTCTIGVLSGATFTCPLVHANASSRSQGAVMNNAIGPFVAADVGKRIFGYNTCNASQALSTSNNLPMSTTATLTISTFTDSAHVVMSGNASNTVTVSSNQEFGGCVIWGNPDDAGATAVDTAMGNAPFCPKLLLAGANYMFTTPHFVGVPTACVALGVIGVGFTQQANIVYSAGFELDGRGPGPTVFYLTPGFPETGACTNGFAGLGCFVVPMEGKWRDISITGGGNFQSTGANSGGSGTMLVEVDGPAELDNFTCTNWGTKNSSGGATLTGIGALSWSRLYQVNPSACGAVQIATNPSANVTIIKASIENFWLWGIAPGFLSDPLNRSFAMVWDQYNTTCYDCQIFTELNFQPGGSSCVVNFSKVKLYHSTCSSQFSSGDNNSFGYYSDVNNSLLDMEDSDYDMTQQGTTTNTGDIGINCTAHPCTVKMKNSIIKGTSGGFGYDDSAGSTFIDLGGNTIGTLSLAGSFLNEAASANLIPVTAAKLVLSANWGTSAAVGTLSGGDAPIQFTVTNGTAATGASPTITYTFPTPYPVAPYSCTATQTGGTNAVGTFTSSGLSATGVTFTFSLTPTINLTEIVNVTCITP